MKSKVTHTIFVEHSVKKEIKKTKNKQTKNKKNARFPSFGGNIRDKLLALDT